MNDLNAVLDRWIEAACVPLEGGHTSGTLEAAEALRQGQPDPGSASIHAAALLGEADHVRRWLQADPRLATAVGGPRGWNSLTYLCFSRYLRLDPARSAGFVAAAQALLDAGADANTGFYSHDHQPHPTHESVLYGAAGIAHHPELTKLLLARGANPNDDEVPYHAPEGFDNRALEALVDSGRLTPDSLTVILHRKLDWTDRRAVRWLLEQGADPNRLSPWGRRGLHHALQCDNPLEFLELLLEAGADPDLANLDGRSAWSIAARAGRGDALDLFARRHGNPAFLGDEAFLAACARGDAAEASEALDRDPGLIGRLSGEQTPLVVTFAGAGNAVGLKLLLEAGFRLDTIDSHGQRHDVMALRVAVWRERIDVVRLLLESGAPVNVPGPRGESLRDLAERAQTEMSEWTPHQTTDVLELVRSATG